MYASIHGAAVEIRPFAYLNANLFFIGTLHGG